MVTIENNCFSIPQICESGQCFRLDAVSEDTYELLAGSRYLKIGIRQKDPADETDGSGKADVHGETILYCTQEEYDSFWKEYFDLSVSYSDYIARIDADDDYLRSAAEFGRGIRILRQDTWEMIITFILSQQNNIPRIKGLIRTLSERYGRRRETPDKRVYYTFPEAEALSKASEQELRDLKLGYRSKYIYCADGRGRSDRSGGSEITGLCRSQGRADAPSRHRRESSGLYLPVCPASDGCVSCGYAYQKSDGASLPGWIPV